MTRSYPRGLSVPTLVLGDILVINLAFLAAHWLRYDLGLGGPVSAVIPYEAYAPWAVVLSVILVLIYQLEGLYSRSRRLTGAETVYAAMTGTIVGVALLTVLLYGLRPLAQSRLMLPYAAGLIIVGVGGLRGLSGRVRSRRLRRGVGVQRTVIVGAGEAGRRIMGTMLADAELGYQVVGFLDDDPEKRSQPLGRYPALGDTSKLAQLLRKAPARASSPRNGHGAADEGGVDTVIITLPWQARERIVELAELAELAGAQVHIVPDLFQMSLNRVDVASLGGIPLIALRAPVIRGWTHGVKRSLDVLSAGTMLLALSPVMAAIAYLISRSSPGPVLYRQVRIGTGGHPFLCLKFRSMREGAHDTLEDLQAHNEASGPLFKMKDDPRVTAIGRFLRRYSLDELPQLWNVLRGDMSLVGPRPPIPDEVERYEEWHRRRLDVAPGMTGLWQVSGRSDLTFDEMVMLDLFYAENWSLALDLKILLRTLPTVLRGTGAY